MDNKIVFGIMTIIFNSYGIPCFMAGNAKAGVLRIVLACVTFGVIGVINAIMGIILGIKLLCMSDEDFAAQKETFFKDIPQDLTNKHMKINPTA